MPQSNGSGLIIMALIILAIGLVALFYPQFFWWLRIGRKAKHPIPPIPAYIAVLRTGGVLTCAVALYLLYYIFFRL